MADAEGKFDPNFVEWQSWSGEGRFAEHRGFLGVQPDGLHVQPLDDYYGGRIDKATAINLARAILEAYEGGGERVRLKRKGGGGYAVIEVKEETDEAWLGRQADSRPSPLGLWPKSAWTRVRSR